MPCSERGSTTSRDASRPRDAALNTTTGYRPDAGPVVAAHLSLTGWPAPGSMAITEGERGDKPMDLEMRIDRLEEALTRLAHAKARTEERVRDRAPAFARTSRARRCLGPVVRDLGPRLVLLPLRARCVIMCHMKTISIRELHERTGAWVRRAAELGSITVTERGRPIARLEAVEGPGRQNPFLTRKLRPGYKRLMGKLTGGTDSVTMVSEDREGR